jgi:hypothetical protein
MDPKTNIILQLRDIWIKLRQEREEVLAKSQSKGLSDNEKEDLRQALEGAEKVLEAHVNNIAMNVKNNFYTWKDVEKIDSVLAIEIEKVLQTKD